MQFLSKHKFLTVQASLLEASKQIIVSEKLMFMLICERRFPRVSKAARSAVCKYLCSKGLFDAIELDKMFAAENLLFESDSGGSSHTSQFSDSDYY